MHFKTLEINEYSLICSKWLTWNKTSHEIISETSNEFAVNSNELWTLNGKWKCALEFDSLFERCSIQSGERSCSEMCNKNVNARIYFYMLKMYIVARIFPDSLQKMHCGNWKSASNFSTCLTHSKAYTSWPIHFQSYSIEIFGVVFQMFIHREIDSLYVK